MLRSSRATMGPEITIGGCRAPCWNNAGRSGYFYSSRALGRTPRRPRGAGEERPADAPPSALRETEEGPVSRPAAPGSLFSVCSLPDSETIGVPHPEPGRGRRRGGSGDSVCLRASPPPSTAPEGLAAGAGARARPACPPRLPWSLAVVTWPGRTSFRPHGIPGLGSSRVGGCHWAPATCVPTLGASDPAVLS